MKVITIGRSHNNDIVVNESQVSRHHVQLVQHDNGVVTLSDMGSKNGTFVNGQRIYGEVTLHTNDKVKIGYTTLLWQNYFPAKKVTTTTNNRWWWIGGVAAAIIAVIVSIFVYLYVENKNFYFEGDYPQPELIKISENGTEYNIEAVPGHVLMYFKDGTSHFQASKLIKQFGGKIIEQMPDFDYYLVKITKGQESDFIGQMKSQSCVEYVFLNGVSYPTSTILVMDQFTADDDDMREMGMSHGEAVSTMIFDFAETPRNQSHIIDIFRESQQLRGQRLSFDNLVCTSLQGHVGLSDNEVALINMSFGHGISKRDNVYYWHQANEEERMSYIKAEQESYELLAECIEKIESNGHSNFVITKASGNEALLEYDQRIIDQLDSAYIEALQRHMIIVNAHDRKRKNIYSNDVTQYNSLVTKIDISETGNHFVNGQLYGWAGTSFAAPQMLGYIDRIIEDYDLSAQEALKAVREVAPREPNDTLSFAKLNLIASKIKQQKEKTTNFDLSGEWRWMSDRIVTDNAGERVPDADFTLELEQSSNKISGYYMAVAMGGNRIDTGEEIHTNNAKGYNSDGNAIIGSIIENVATVKFTSESWGGSGTATIKILSENKIEWTIISSNGDHYAPTNVILYRNLPKEGDVDEYYTQPTDYTGNDATMIFTRIKNYSRI